MITRYRHTKQLLIASAACVITSTAIASTPDFSVLTKATDAFCEKMAALEKDLSLVDTAKGTAKSIDRWAAANDAFTDVFESFVRANLAYLREHAQDAPPEEITKAFAKVTRLKEDYPTLQPTLRVLIARFQTYPDVVAAMQKFQSSLERIQRRLTEFSAP